MSGARFVLAPLVAGRTVSGFFLKKKWVQDDLPAEYVRSPRSGSNPNTFEACAPSVWMKGEHDCWLDGRARAIGINMQKFAGSCYQFEHELIDKRLFFLPFFIAKVDVPTHPIGGGNGHCSDTVSPTHKLCIMETCTLDRNNSYAHIYIYIWVTIKTPAEEFYTNVWMEYVVVNL